MCECCDRDAARGGSSDDRRRTAEFQRLHRARVRSLIAADSWLVTAVDGWPPFAYTTGLWSRGRAELCVFGLDQRSAGGLLNRVGAAILEGTRVEDGDDLRIDGLPLRVFHLPNPGEILLATNAFYRRKPRNAVPAVQLVYPDAHNVWPWEPECHLYPGQQPLPGTFAA